MSRTRRLVLEPLEVRQLLAADTLIAPPEDAYDVNGDQRVTAADALVVANVVNSEITGFISSSAAEVSGDVDGDGTVTSSDFSLVTGQLNSQSEPEPAADDEENSEEEDGGGDSDVNQAPEVFPDLYEINRVVHDEGAPGVLENDWDPDEDALSVTLIDGPSSGTLLSFNSDGSFVYRPAPGFAGTDTFTYEASDGDLTARSVATIVVNNRAPQASDDTYTAVANTTLRVDAVQGVLSNDEDEDTLDGMAAILINSTSHGDLQLYGDGSFTYTPHPGYVGQDRFSYRATDNIDISNLAVVELFVVHPRVDLDADSDNNGALESSLAEDSIEMDAPGKIVRYNDDDDNSNRTADHDDLLPMRGPDGTAVLDDELVPVRLQLDFAGERLQDYIFALDYLGNELRFWASADKQPLNQTAFRIGQDPLPGQIFAEGIRPGVAVVDLVLWSRYGEEVHRDRVRFTVVDFDLKAYRPQTEGVGYGQPFARTLVPEAAEGQVGIRSNGDDDDQNGVADRWQSTAITGENDLIEVVLEADPAAAPGIEYRLRRSNGNIAVWNGAEKRGPLLVTQDVAPAGLGSHWVEWIGMDRPATSDLTMEVVATNTNQVALRDDVAFQPFRSVVIVLGGEFQAPSDPPQATHGMFRWGRDQFRNGYDVHMYDEDEVKWGTAEGPVYDEIVNAIERRGVTQVALVGYSHGGGAVYELADRLATNPDNQITRPFTLALTGYVDGIRQRSTLSERRRPPLSVFHANQYQRNDLLLKGNTSNGDDDLDRSILGVVHADIDDHPAVLDLLETRLRQRVNR